MLWTCILYPGSQCWMNFTIGVLSKLCRPSTPPTCNARSLASRTRISADKLTSILCLCSSVHKNNLCKLCYGDTLGNARQASSRVTRSLDPLTPWNLQQNPFLPHEQGQGVHTSRHEQHRTEFSTASLKVRIPSFDLTKSREKLQIQNETPNVAFDQRPQLDPSCA